ncbi:type 1 glutamine amidotransferase [Pseudonocardia sp. GCM10023141]|uniref:type 1 glutamine amidotransferase n=1 Tax=Pseudonocardia sp. GCM10023141 TaxID=3252653 RepID=UPI0036D2FCCF
MLGLLRDALVASGYEPRTCSVVAGEPLPREVDIVIALGSEASACDDGLPWLNVELDYLRGAIESEIPILGVCFGAQVLARALGGTVKPGDVPELGFIEVDTDVPDLLPTGPWVSSHYDVIDPPPSARVIARTELAVQAFVYGPHLGIQFHPETDIGVLHAWRGRRLVGLEAGDAQLATWLDLDAVAEVLAAESERRAAMCQGIVDAFTSGKFAALQPSSGDSRA